MAEPNSDLNNVHSHRFLFSPCAHGRFAWLISIFTFFQKDAAPFPEPLFALFPVKSAEIQGKASSSVCGLGFSKPDFIFHHKEHSQAHILLPSSWVYKGTLTVAGFYEIWILYIIWIILYINHIIHYMNYNSMNYFMQNLHWQPTKGCLLNFLWGALTLFWGCCFSSFLSGLFFCVE